MFSVTFTQAYGITYHEGKDFSTEKDAVDYAVESLRNSASYLHATVKHQLFPILTVRR